MKAEVSAEEGNRNQYMKMIMLQKYYQKWYERKQHHKLIWGHLKEICYRLYILHVNVSRVS